MKNYLKLLSIIICLTILCSELAQAEKQIKVTFINPAKDEKFWQSAVSVMKAACSDLKIDLEEIALQRNHIAYQKFALEIVQRKTPPDYLIIVNEKGIAADIIKEADKTGVKIMLIVNGLLPEQVTDSGLPRQKYPSWIGTMIPDNISAGYTGGKLLLENALKSGMKAKDGRVHVSGIAGAMATSASLDRVKGFEKAVGEFPNVALKQIVPDHDWSKEKAKMIAAGLLKRYPETSAIWAANDPIALGAIEGAEASGKQPGKDCFFTGVNWDSSAIEFIKNGKLAASVGGHFLIGGWAIVLIYDHAHGKDFSDIGVHIEQPMFAITSENADTYLGKFGNQQWESIDFKKFSRAINPQLKTYDFNLESILEHQ